MVYNRCYIFCGKYESLVYKKIVVFKNSFTMNSEHKAKQLENKVLKYLTSLTFNDRWCIFLFLEDLILVRDKY